MRNNILTSVLDVGSLTNPGKIRKNNEDSILVLPQYGCFAVADGMGGGEAGEIASKMVVDAINDKLKKESYLPAARERAVIRASYGCNLAINDYCNEHLYESMGSTLACLLFDPWDPEFATVFHAGDSRVYLWRERKLQCLTTDHTLAESAELPEYELNKAYQGVLTNVIGIASDFYLERLSCNVKQDDVFLICSDGLTRMVSDEGISHILRQCDRNVGSTFVTQLLLAEALNNGGHDNVSVILVKVSKQGQPYEPLDMELQEEMYIQEQNIDDLSDTLPTGESIG